MRKITLVLFLIFNYAFAQQPIKAKQVVNKMDKLLLSYQVDSAINLLNTALKNPQNNADVKAYYYSHLAVIHLNIDSLKQGRSFTELAIDQIPKAKDPGAIAMAYRAKAYLNSYLNLPDEVIKTALQGLKVIESVDEPLIKYYLNYLLYATYSGWNDSKKMEHYIKACEKYAKQAGNHNQEANVYLGYNSFFLFRYRKDKNPADLDSSFLYLQKSDAICQQFPKEVSGNTKVMAAVNLANYYLESDPGNLIDRKNKAYAFLDKAQEVLLKGHAQFGRWVNVYGIKSGFAMLENNIPLAEQYLIAALNRLDERKDNSLLKLEYKVFKELSELAVKKNDLKSAINYQMKAEDILKKNYDQTQLLNAQKLEVQFETDKKDQQLKLLAETAELRKKLNYLYGGLAIFAILGLAFMFRSYHFKLRYSIAREKQLAKEKEVAEKNAKMQVLLEKEEQGRLKAEQELLELKHQQLQKEALANSLLIDHKNDMLKQIKSKLQEGDSRQIQKLLKEETLMNADFEDIKWQIQQLHPNFFQQLMEKANQKLTALDLKYCAYIYLQMSTKQIAQIMHVEPQSVRMFKYRLKQKFALDKESDLETFLQEVSI